MYPVVDCSHFCVFQGNVSAKNCSAACLFSSTPRPSNRSEIFSEFFEFAHNQVIVSGEAQF
jgi:hypothetical protein